MKCLIPSNAILPILEDMIILQNNKYTLCRFSPHPLMIIFVLMVCKIRTVHTIIIALYIHDLSIVQGLCGSKHVLKHQNHLCS